MMKKFLVLGSVYLACNLSASAIDGAGTSSLSFNSKSFDNGFAAGFKTDDDYYTLTLSDGAFSEEGGRFIGAIIYIPTALLTAGTYDLVVLKPSKSSNTAEVCSEDEVQEFKLPSNDKVYLYLSDTSLKATEKTLTTKGAVATGQVEQGSITFTSIDNNFLGMIVNGNFEINTKVSTYSATIPSDSLELTCKQALKKTKIKFNKNSKTSQAEGSLENALIIDLNNDIGEDDDDFDFGDFDFKVLPNSQLIKVQ